MPERTNGNERKQNKRTLYTDVEGRGCLTVMELKSNGSESQTKTNAGLHILTAKATGLVVILLASTNKTKKRSAFSQFPKFHSNMNPNSRQVYTCISSADKLCISHTAYIILF